MTGTTGRFFVLTGGPGSGKTTLANALRDESFAVAEEAGRRIIKEQAAVSGNALPWADRTAFARAMFARDLESYTVALKHPAVTIFDRGIPDVIGYLELEELPVPADLTRAAKQYRYDRRVFIAPPWPEIFAQDSERKQTFEIAERTCRAMEKVYRDLGYELIELPRAPVDARVTFVRGLIGP